MRNGIVYGMSNEIYHDGDEVSCSKLKAASRSLAHYRYGEVKISDKAALEGTLGHCAILEPAELNNRFAVGPQCDKRTKAGKAEWEDFISANPGKEIITQEQYDMAVGMQDVVAGNDEAMELMAGGTAEVSIFWEDSESGLMCKCRPDWLGERVIVDVKTTDDCRQFSSSVSKFGYHIQAPWYLEGARQALLDVDSFVFLVIEKTPPYEMMLYELSPEYMEAGMAIARKALHGIALAKSNGYYPGYSKGIVTLQKPSWIGA